MKFQVVLLSCFFILGTGSSASTQRPEEKNVEESDDLKELLGEFSDTTAKWNSLVEKFDKVETTECSLPANEAVCKSIREQVKSRNSNEEKDEQMDKEMNVLNSILTSIHEKVEKLDRKMESGVGGSSISTRDYINAMKGLERRLQSFQTSVMSLGREMRMPAKYVEGTDDEDVKRPERRSYDLDDVNGIKHLGKTCKLLIGPYKKLLNNVDRLEGIVKSMSSNDGAVCAMRLQKSGDKLKDIKYMLKGIAEDVKTLSSMSRREIEENEKILKKILYKLKEEINDDDKDDKALQKSLKSFMVKQRKKLEDFISEAVAKLEKSDKDSDDDCDDSDECKKKKGVDTDDTDDTDDDEDEVDNSCNDSDGCDRKKNGKDTDDSDDDDDDDDTDDGKRKKRPSKNDTDDDDDDDDDDDSDDDDDDDTDDDTDDKKSKGKKKNRENLTKKYLPVEDKSHKDVEVLRNSASAGPYGTQKFMTSLFGIPPYIDH
ncbi:UNVERIFIED_CONTAM: hypothetical protein PYX00_006952 [Menopon gallinae]|uniref:Uncharacterized protein n=1 Tax=Menopon gallinae TaxID=328185 RepID=A0AAW2HH45_9NEOP